MPRSPRRPVPGRRAAHRPRWQRRPDARPEEILTAALDVFGERGFAGARCDEVARRAGVSKGTLYLYFDSKEALFREMVRVKIEGLIASAEEFVRGWEGSSADLFTAILERYWATVNRPQHLRLSRLVLSELGSFPELARFYYQTIVLRGRRVLEAVIERGMATGEFRRIDPVLAARAVQTLCVQLAQYRSCFQQYDTTPVSAETLLRGMIDLHLHGLLGAPDASPPAPES